MDLYDNDWQSLKKTLKRLDETANKTVSCYNFSYEEREEEESRVEVEDRALVVINAHYLLFSGEYKNLIDLIGRKKIKSATVLHCFKKEF